MRSGGDVSMELDVLEELSLGCELRGSGCTQGWVPNRVTEEMKGKCLA